MKSATRSPAIGSTGCGRSTAAITVASGWRACTAERTARTCPASASGGSLIVITTTSEISTPVRPQAGGQVLGRAGGRRDEDRAVRGHRRQRRARSLEQEQLRRVLAGEGDRLLDVRVKRRAREAAAAPARADRRHPGQRRVLEEVRRGVLSGPRALEQIVQRRRRDGPVDQLGLLGAAPAHRDQHQPVALAQEPGQMAAHRGLPDPLGGADNRDRRHARGDLRRRPELEIGPAIREPGRERAADQAEAVALAQHRLVGEVDHALGRVLGRRRDHAGGGIRARVLERHAVVRLPAQLLGAAQEQRGDDMIVAARGGDRRAHDRRVVLAVDQHERALRHWPPAAASCGGGVCFSYSKVWGENRIRRSRPWNGYFRYTPTSAAPTSTML